MNDLRKHCWYNFYTNRPDIFLEDYFGFKLKWYQRLLIHMLRLRSLHKHEYELAERSNVLQQDDMGYPLRLFIYRCKKCGASTQKWVDVNEDELKDLKTGQSVLLKWTKA